MNRASIIATIAGGSWIGTFIAWVGNHGLATACGIASLVASIYAIRVGILTARLKKLEIDKLSK